MLFKVNIRQVQTLNNEIQEGVLWQRCPACLMSVIVMKKMKVTYFSFRLALVILELVVELMPRPVVTARGIHVLFYESEHRRRL